MFDYSLLYLERIEVAKGGRYSVKGSFIESVVHRRVRYIDILIRFLWIGCTVWGTFLLFPINGMLMIFFLGINATFMFWFWNMYKVDYEYIYCDGQIDFDVIKDNRKRKHKLRIQLEDAVLLAEPNSEKVINYPDVRAVVKFISNERPNKVYALIVKKQDRLIKVLFEPNYEMLKSIKYKMPRKVELRQEDLDKINGIDKEKLDEDDI